MKHLFLLLAAVAAFGAAEARNAEIPNAEARNAALRNAETETSEAPESKVPKAKITKVVYQVSVANAPTWAVVRDVPADAAGATVYLLDGHRTRTELPSQLDDLDGDGRFDELVFPVPASAQPLRVRVDYSTAPVAHDYTPLVNAQMWWKNPDKSLTETAQLSSDKDDMYHKLHHHGPAFESDRAAYRVYFDKKQSIDTYGKKQPGLELRETMWYPTDGQLAEGSGHDNLRVFGSISVGVLKGWDAKKQKMLHITEMSRREATIRAAGPVRTVVDMRVEGWRYGGRTLTMTSRYILYAGHADVQVENRLEGDFAGLDFVTGVMKIKNGAYDGTQGDERQMILCSTGTDYPENDTVRWQPERVTLAVAVDRARVVAPVEDPLSHLVLVRPDAEGRLDYRMVMLWQKNSWLPARFWGDEWAAAAAEELRPLRRPVVTRIK